jgi:catechol 2,3-dioxygenase-like lactoylglutathione lyase family enzyme
MEIGFVTIDCHDAERLIEFWSEALGYEVKRSVYTTLRDPAGKGVSLYLQEVPEPRTAKNRVHLDLVSPDFDRDLRRLLELGASKGTNMEENGIRWTVLEDPEGNVFCLFDDSD